MKVTKCDNCNNIIKDTEKRVTAGIGWDSNEFCMDCGKPVVKFLITKKFTNKKKLLNLK